MTARVAESACIASASACAMNFSQPERPLRSPRKSLSMSRTSPVKTLLETAPAAMSLLSVSLRPAIILESSRKLLRIGTPLVPVVIHAAIGSRITCRKAYVGKRVTTLRKKSAGMPMILNTAGMEVAIPSMLFTNNSAGMPKVSVSTTAYFFLPSSRNRTMLLPAGPSPSEMRLTAPSLNSA